MSTATPPRGQPTAVLGDVGRAQASYFRPSPPVETHLLSAHPTVITHGMNTIRNHVRGIPAFNNEEINCVPHDSR